MAAKRIALMASDPTESCPLLDTERRFNFDAYLNETAEERKVDPERKARVYAKIQELRDENVAQICDVYVYGHSYQTCWTLGEAYSGFWSLHFPHPERRNQGTAGSRREVGGDKRRRLGGLRPHGNESIRRADRSWLAMGGRREGAGDHR